MKNEQKTPLWRDERFWQVAIQAIALILLITIISVMIGNMNRNMAQQGVKFGFSFLQNTAGFEIGEELIPYTPQDTYARALLVGLVNSLRVMILGIIMATMVGVIAGLASFSDNWLLRKLNRIYVEIVRNTPLLLQLFFWYFAVFFSLPKAQERLLLPGPVFMSKRGITIPWPNNTVSVWLWLSVAVILAIAFFLCWQWRQKIMVENGVSGQPQLIALITIAIALVLIIIFGLHWQAPVESQPGQIAGGLNVSLELSAILAGLVFYTGAFIAEIVRAGIQAVPKGQWEAARSLGLKSGLVMRLVIFPQALRVIIPPLNSEYVNLAKNTSLAIAIGYPDLYSVANTTFNQTNKPIEVFLIIMATYLSINFIISLCMNGLNQLVQIKER
jgi:general L-amino acid transport system permease protein